MADLKLIIPFIKKAEGGYVNDPLDKGGETMQGITYAVWCSVFGPNAHERFIKMAATDWEQLFKTLFWDKIQGDKINSQRIANTVVDWVWGSGLYYPKLNLQIILKNLGSNIKLDSIFGNGTLSALNSADEDAVYKALISKRFDFIDNIVAHNPSQVRFVQGWKNRLNALDKFNNPI
jgi:lysozyme family protein